MTNVGSSSGTPGRPATRAVRVPNVPNAEHLAFRLVSSLLGKTNEGKIRWRVVRGEDEEPNDVADDPRYEVDLPSGNVDIGTADGDGRSPFDLKLFTSGPPYRLVDAFNGREDRTLNEALALLYRAARRSANGTDRVLRALLDDLEGPDEELPF